MTEFLRELEDIPPMGGGTTVIGYIGANVLGKVREVSAVPPESPRIEHQPDGSTILNLSSIIEPPPKMPGEEDDEEDDT
jgi:hypothetical protein